MSDFDITWDESTKRFYETGVDRGTLFVMEDGAYGDGVAWSGLTSISEKPSGAENTALYADNIKYLNLKSTEEFGATIEAYMYPDEWKKCDGAASIATGVTIGQQKRSVFGLAYRTRIGNDTDGDSHAYKIHLIYGAEANPSERSYETVNDSPSAATLSWEITTTPINVDGHQPTATIEIDSRYVNAAKLASFEKILYGTPAGEGGTGEVKPRLPLPAEVASHFATVQG